MHSMTGFGRGQHATHQYVARVEISSVNRKQADIVFNLPRELGELEAPMKKRVLTHVSRGRVNINITLEKSSSSNQSVQIDPAKVKAIESAFSEISSLLGRQIQASSTDFLRVPELFLFGETKINPEAAGEALLPALDAALQDFLTMREREGQDLKNDLLLRLSRLEKGIEQIKTLAPSVILQHRGNLHQKLRDQQIDIDLNDERFLKEVALFADRCDITEEITRLRSHFTKFREYIEAEKACGRSLDFLCQEMNREFNTIGSKANDATLAQHVVTAKTELEKIREQVQNVE